MKRRLAREVAVASLYQMEMNEVTAAEAVDMIVAELHTDNEIGAKESDIGKTDDFARSLVAGVLEHKSAIDDMLQQYLTGWQVDRLSRVDKQILRLACYEIMFASGVPPKAAVNEAIELAKHFGTDESGRFVNGVLGKLLKGLQQAEAEEQNDKQ